MAGRKQIYLVKKCILLSIFLLNGQTNYRDILKIVTNTNFLILIAI